MKESYLTKAFRKTAHERFPEQEAVLNSAFEKRLGELGILANHSNMIAAVVPGVLRGQFPDRPPQTAAVSGGVVKIEDNEVLILADTAERPEEIDANRARRAEANAREALLQKKSIQEYRSAQAYLARALNRLKVRENYR